MTADPIGAATLQALALEMRRLALIAGAETLRFHGAKDLSVESKEDESPLTAADLAANQVIVDGLRAAFPDVALMSEETVEQDSNDQAFLSASRYFLIDPLDGTKEFVRGGPDYTVNIALVDTGRPVLGAVYAPATGRLFWTPAPDRAVEERVAGADAGAAPAPASDPRELRVVAAADNTALRVVASKSHRGASTDAYISRYQISDLVSAGSSLKICMVAGGEADMYPRLGLTSAWDTAAAHAVLLAAGGELRAMAEDGQVGAPLAYATDRILNPFFIAYAPSVTLR